MNDNYDDRHIIFIIYMVIYKIYNKHDYIQIVSCVVETLYI